MPVLKSKINARRVLEAISHIGYSSHSAISDIVDNSVSAKASEVSIKIKASFYARKNSIHEIQIIDNGTGMDGDELENCLALGSSAEHYSKNSLSKFGMGLKSAGLSLGERISIVSKKGGAINKIVLDLEKIAEEYNLEKEAITAEDQEILENFENGTCIKVDKLRKQHPTCKNLMKSLEEEMSEIYYPMLEDATLKIKLIAFSEEEEFENKGIEPFDPLFENQCHEDLNPNIWDGQTPCWLLKKHSIEMDDISPDIPPIYITCTHLVHPPIFSFGDTELTQKEARDKYRIGAGRNAFYIYRNNRLICRDYLGILTREQSHFAFRGRIDISTEHDEELMLDVKKSSIRFPEDILEKIQRKVDPLKSSSRKAWSKLSNKYKDKLSEEKHSEQRDKTLGQLEEPYEKPSVELKPEEKQKRETILQAAYENEHIERMDSDKRDEYRVIEEPLSKQKIEYVPALDFDQVYVPYQVQDQVRINISKAHKFQQFLSNYSEDIPYEVQQVIEILFLSLAYAEISVGRNFTHEDFSDQEKLSKLLVCILDEFRHDFSINLSKNLSRVERILLDEDE